MNSHTTVLETLLRAGASVDTVERSGKNALMLAAMAGSVECCTVVLAFMNGHRTVHIDDQDYVGEINQ
jgi:ankyrin repeat protein